MQFHYDAGRAFYGSELSNRPLWTATIENFSADKWGSTYFFVDGNFSENSMHSVYGEFARELRFWKAPIAIHLEYNGGLSGKTGSYNDAYLLGAVTTGLTAITARHSLSKRCINILLNKKWALTTVGN